MSLPAPRDVIDALIDIALDAGASIMEIYATDFAVDNKTDASPVTAADKKGEAIILRELNAFAPSVPVLAEEAASEGEIPDLGDEFFLVDPLDGTREFINRTGEFTVNIALVRHGEPVLGVVFAPAIKKLYAGAKDIGAFMMITDENGKRGALNPIAARAPAEDGMVAVASRSHRSPETDQFLSELKIKDFAAAGSSLKFCLIAEGAADIYPRLGRTMEWDTGAGQAVLEAAGGGVDAHPSGERLLYKKAERGYDNPHFIAWGRRPA